MQDASAARNWQTDGFAVCFLCVAAIFLFDRSRSERYVDRHDGTAPRALRVARLFSPCLPEVPANDLRQAEIGLNEPYWRSVP